MSSENRNMCTCGCCEGASHLTPLNVENKPGLSALHYRVGTHSSFKKSMLRSVSGNKAMASLTSRAVDDMGIATLDAWSTVLDVLTFYQERILNEGYLRTATERFSIVELARLISYAPEPGVAAGTFLAFSMSESPGAPAAAVIPAGSKVQSVPEQSQMPQAFETTEPLEARLEWNAIKLQTRKRIIPAQGDTALYLKGINTGLQPGDGLLLIGDERKKDVANEQWDFRKVKEVVTDTSAGYTKVIWSKGLGYAKNGKIVKPARLGVKVYALRQRASLFGYNAPEWRLLSKEVRDRFLSDGSSEENNELEWEGFDIRTVAFAEDVIHLDHIYPKILKGDWVVLSTPDYEEVYEVEAAAESARKEFSLASKTMALKIKGEHLYEKFNTRIRDTVVYAQCEELEIADKPVTDAMAAGEKQITLETRIRGLTEKKAVLISGKRKRLLIPEAKDYPVFKVPGDAKATRKLNAGDSLLILKEVGLMENGKTKWRVLDSTGVEGEVELIMSDSKKEVIASAKEDETVSELHTIELVKQDTDPTILVLKEPVANCYDPFTVVVRANVAAATHGETRQEVLGSGDGSQPFQKFELKQSPLTFVSAATATGASTTLQVRVNGILWKEAATLYGALPTDKVYVASSSDKGQVTIQFGDGITGARLPTGTENVRASYRVGIGTPGVLHAGQLSMLMTPQLGITAVTNLLGTSGAADPESRDEARHSAPLTVLTLDRIVSVRDFENFTRAFAGIAKARAEMVWSGEKQVVHITVAAKDQSALDKKSDLYVNLMKAVREAGRSNHTVYIENYHRKSFSVKAAIKVDSTYQFEHVRDKVLQSLNDTFSFSSRDFGQDITPAEIIAAIQKVEGVLYTLLQLLNGIAPLSQQHFRLRAGLAFLEKNGSISPAELLVIHPNEIYITEIVA